MKWHSVLRKMPPPNVKVLIYSPLNATEIDVSYFCDTLESWRRIDGMVVGEPVTHWMELPQPPEAKR